MTPAVMIRLSVGPANGVCAMSTSTKPVLTASSTVADILRDYDKLDAGFPIVRLHSLATIGDNKCHLTKECMMPNFLQSPLQKRYAATQSRFTVPKVTGQYEQQPQNSGLFGMNPYGAFRPRQSPPAPWMNPQNPITMGQYNQPQFASTAPAQDSVQQLFNSRQSRADASGGRLIAQPGPVPGANRGNYNYSYGGKGNDADGNATPSQGIDINSMVMANPNAAAGLLPQSRAQLATPAREAIALDLKARQSAHQQRQGALAEALAGRKQMVAQRGMAQGANRVARLEARKNGPSFMDQLLQNGDPETALAMAEMNQRGQLGLAQLLAQREGNAGLKESRLAEAALNTARADPVRMEQERRMQLVEGDESLTPEEKQAFVFGQQPGVKGPPSKAKVQEEAKLSGLLRTDPQAAVDTMRAQGIPDSEIEGRLAGSFDGDSNSAGAYGRSFLTGTRATPPTPDNPLGGSDVSPSILNPWGIGAGIAAGQNWLFPPKPVRPTVQGNTILPGWERDPKTGQLRKKSKAPAPAQSNDMSGQWMN